MRKLREKHALNGARPEEAMEEETTANPADDNLSYYFDNCVGPKPQGERRIWGIEDAEGL
jgi:hypothetical protein